MKTNNAIKLALLAVLLHGVTVSAQTYNYAAGDLLAAFGRSGSSKDVIVDLGSASLYQNATGSFNIAGVNSILLTTALGSLDGVYWTVFGYVNGQHAKFIADLQRPGTGRQQDDGHRDWGRL